MNLVNIKGTFFLHPSNRNGRPGLKTTRFLAAGVVVATGIVPATKFHEHFLEYYPALEGQRTRSCLEHDFLCVSGTGASPVGVSNKKAELWTQPLCSRISKSRAGRACGSVCVGVPLNGGRSGAKTCSPGTQPPPPTRGFRGSWPSRYTPEHKDRLAPKDPPVSIVQCQLQQDTLDEILKANPRLKNSCSPEVIEASHTVE